MLPSYITFSRWPRSVKTKIEPLEHYFEQHVVWVIHYIYYLKKTWKWFPRVWRYVWITHTIPYLWFTENSASVETISINIETIVETISLTIINQYYQYRRPRFCNLCTVRVETKVLRCWTRLPGVRDPSESPAQGIHSKLFLVDFTGIYRDL